MFMCSHYDPLGLRLSAVTNPVRSTVVSSWQTTQVGMLAGHTSHKEAGGSTTPSLSAVSSEMLSEKDFGDERT